MMLLLLFVTSSQEKIGAFNCTLQEYKGPSRVVFEHWSGLLPYGVGKKKKKNGGFFAAKIGVRLMHRDLR